MADWQGIKAFGMDTLLWWEVVVKPGIRKLGMLRGKQMAKDSRSELNLLLVRQSYLNRKVKLGHANNLAELRTVVCTASSSNGIKSSVKKSSWSQGHLNFRNQRK
jgi:hypothetical protein